MGGPNITTPSAEPTSSVLSAYTQYLPGLVGATAAQEPNVAQNQLNATLGTQPIYNALNLQQAQQYAQPLAQVGQQVQNSNALAGAQTNLNQIYGPGGQSALAAYQLSQAANPNYYTAMNPAAQQASNLMGAINLNGLSPGEQNSVERSLNQTNQATGNLGLNNATNDVANAMNFGGAFNSKIGILSNALGAANQTANTAQNTGFSPVNIALGQPNTSTLSNFGTGTFSPTSSTTQSGAANTAFGFGSSALNNMASMNNAFTGAGAQLGSTATQAYSPTSYMNACCFIFLEAYHGTMPSYVRTCRDKYYTNFPAIANGYRRMARWLVPLMQRNFIIRSLVWLLMVEPLTKYGAFVTRRTADGRSYRFYRKLWFTLWRYYGSR